MPRYRLRPPEIDAIFYTGLNYLEVIGFTESDQVEGNFTLDSGLTLHIGTPRGTLSVRRSDYVLRATPPGATEPYYSVMSSSDFHQTYMPIE